MIIMVEMELDFVGLILTVTIMVRRGMFTKTIGRLMVEYIEMQIMVMVNMIFPTKLTIKHFVMLLVLTNHGNVP